MEVISTPIDDLYVLKPLIFKDERGYFFESFNEKKFLSNELNYNFVQDNQSFSSYGTLRGLHFQIGNHEQAKLVRAVQGKVLDVAVDLRKGSRTFLKTYSVELTGENFLQLLIPRGFAHGFVVLSETAIFQYKCDNFYSYENERGVIYSDPQLSIDWNLKPNEIVLSEKDKKLPSLNDLLGEC